MKKKLIILTIISIIAIGVATNFVFAKESPQDLMEDKNSKLSFNMHMSTSKSGNIHEEMLKLMDENGYKDISKAIEDQDYEVMDDFMNNMTEEDYNKMTNIMRENGYESMSDMMESVGREEMLQMHNAMGGAEDCH
jgi:peptidoglycan hydrolase CwlO-like protein